MKKYPQLLSKKIIAKTNIFTVEQLHLQFGNSIEVNFERIYSGSAGAVLIVPQLDNDTIILIREYCAGVLRYEIAFPKGRVEQEESIFVSANREMMEEIGYGANSLQHMKSVSVSPGYMSHQTHIVHATDLYHQKLEGDEPEPIEVLYWKLDKLDDLLMNDEFTEARSIAALYLLKEKLLKDKLMKDKPTQKNNIHGS
jgi:ADP-ribose diphosphatase